MKQKKINKSKNTNSLIIDAMNNMKSSQKYHQIKLKIINYIKNIQNIIKINTLKILNKCKKISQDEKVRNKLKQYKTKIQNICLYIDKKLINGRDIEIDKNNLKIELIANLEKEKTRTKRVIVYILGFFLVWSIFAKINSSIVAQGVFVPMSRKKIIQHLENGIVDKILVKEGEFVKKGQILIRLNESSANANLTLLKYQFYSKKIQKYRMIAEMEGKKEIKLESELQKEIEKSPELKRFYSEELSLLKQNVNILGEKIKMSKSQNKQNSKYIIGLKNKLIKNEEKMKILRKEQKVLRNLEDRDLGEYDKSMYVEKEIINLENENIQTSSELEKLQEKAKESEINIELIDKTEKQTLQDNMQKTQIEINQIASRLIEASDIFERLEVKSPVNGIISTININGSGQNVNYTSNILEIIPTEEDIIIEAKVSPRDISAVQSGAETKIITILPNQKLAPAMYGTVFYVSNDVITDHNGATYFIIKINISANELSKYKHQKIIPGMYAQVFVKIKEKRFISHLLDPLFFSFLMSFNEK